jgi:hypothetical protein
VGVGCEEGDWECLRTDLELVQVQVRKQVQVQIRVRL